MTNSLVLITFSLSSSCYDIQWTVANITLSVWISTVLDACTSTANGTHLADNPCSNHGHCDNGTRSDSPGTYHCECPVGYTGKHCESGLTATVYNVCCFLWTSLVYAVLGTPVRPSVRHFVCVMPSVSPKSESNRKLTFSKGLHVAGETI